MIKEATTMNQGTLAMPSDAVLKLRSLRLELAETEPTSEAVDPNVGGGVDREKIPAADFAGKNRSFPIVSPKDVADAAASIGRAGADNYSSDELKRRIIAIAKRKGAAFVARLPKAWQESESDLGDETEELLGDCIALSERAVADDGTFPVKLIEPGWGSSGYYSKEVLQRDVPRAFPAGTQMFWNHQTPKEAEQRPEGDLRGLAAVLVETPHYDETGAAGAGMYARGKAFGDYKASIEELAPHIGVSIRYWGHGVKGEAEGRKGRIIADLETGRSVDFVTRPGAGGRVLELFESARSGAPIASPKGAHDMAEETALQEAKAQLAEAQTKLTAAEATVSEQAATIAAAHEADMLAQAKAVVTEALAKAKLPDVTKTRLAGVLAANPPVKDGALDEVAYAEAIKTAIDAAAAEVAAIAGARVTGMGGGGTSGGKTALRESFVSKYLAEGRSKDIAEQMADLATSRR